MCRENEAPLELVAGWHKLALALRKKVIDVRVALAKIARQLSGIPRCSRRRRRFSVDNYIWCPRTKVGTYVWCHRDQNGTFS